MSDPIALSMTQQFEVERMKRIISNTTDVADLQKLCTELFVAWQGQKAAAAWAFRQSLPPPLIKNDGR